MIHFEVPKKLIAQEPVSPRDLAKLLVYERGSRQITDDYFYNLLSYVPNPSLVVANNSKVEQCRLLFNEGKREIFVVEAVNDKTVRALVRPGKVFKLGKTVVLTAAVSAVVTAVDEEGVRTIEFSTSRDHPDLTAAQHVPLPPYIAQNDLLAREYQTVYAKQLGSKAAPTAGLHFTPELKQKVQTERDWAEVTLHVGLGTFASLTDENFKTGRLHEELYEVSPATAEKIASAEHVTAVGTTSARTLEALASKSPVTSSSLRPAAHAVESRSLGRSFDFAQDDLRGATDIFIQPGYEFKRVNALITNFHLPGTSLLLLVEAFIGSESEMQRIYTHAIEHNYRFYSFGDAMLIV